MDEAGELEEDGAEEADAHEGEFGFVTLDRTHTLKSFTAYAEWAKTLHFSKPEEKVGPLLKPHCSNPKNAKRPHQPLLLRPGAGSAAR